MTIYNCYLNAILMPDQDVSKEVLLLLGPCWDGVKKIFFLSQLGMRNICRECFCFLNGISLGKLRTLMEKKKKEESSVTRKEGSGRRPEEATLDAELWFHDLIKNVGEQSPESDLVYLPPATKADFWREYQDDRKEQERIVSKATFYNLWKTKFKHLKVRPICLLLVDGDETAIGEVYFLHQVPRTPRRREGPQGSIRSVTLTFFRRFGKRFERR